MFDVKKRMLVWKQATCQVCWWYLFVMRASNIVSSDGFFTISPITISSMVVSTLLRTFKKISTVSIFSIMRFKFEILHEGYQLMKTHQKHLWVNCNKNTEKLSFYHNLCIFRLDWRQPLKQTMLLQSSFNSVVAKINKFYLIVGWAASVSEV